MRNFNVMQQSLKNPCSFGVAISNITENSVGASPITTDAQSRRNKNRRRSERAHQPTFDGFTLLDDFADEPDHCFFLFYLSTKVLKRVGKRIFSSAVGKYIELAPALAIKIVGESPCKKDYVNLLSSVLSDIGYNLKPSRGQMFTSISKTITDVKRMFTTSVEVTDIMQNFVSLIGALKENIDVSFLVDIALLVMQFVGNEQITIANVVSLLVSLYRIYVKSASIIDQMSINRAQTGVDPLCLSIISLFLPKNLLEIIKRMSLFTSVKLCDEPSFIYTILDTVFDYVVALVDYLPCATTVKDTIRNGLESFAFGSHFRKMREAMSLHTQWKRDPKVAMDHIFISNFNEVYQSMSNDESLKSLSRRSGMVASTLKDLERISKCIKAYETTVRVEPSCFVFEGPPGCFKSKLMAELIKCTQKTTYTHTVKNVKDGKDFYDTYNNEYNFVMDDVGQQGVSQWRSIINMVSNIKLPLDCAECSLKDTKFFNSENIFVTTNNFMNIGSVLRDDCIDTIEALHRRGYVFDFSSVTRSGSNLSGLMRFKHYDLTTHKFVLGFPAEFREFCHHNNNTIPDSLDLNSTTRNEILSWMLSIVNIFNILKTRNADPNHLTSDDIESIIAASQIYETSSSQYMEKFTINYMDHHIQMVTDQLHSGYKCLANLASRYFNSNSKLNIAMDALAMVYPLTLGFLMYKILMGMRASPSISQVFKNLKIKNSKEPSTPVQTVQRATFDMDIEHSGGMFSVCGILSGHCIVTVAHAAFMPEGYVTVYKNRDTKSILVDHISFKTVFRDVKADVAILALPRTYPSPFKNISKFFVNNQTHSDVYSSIDNRPHDQQYAKDLWYVTCVGEIYMPMFIKVSKSNVIYTIDFERDEYNIIKVADSPAHGQPVGVQFGISAPGLCGSSIVHENGSILGMHVAGNEDGVGTAIVWSASIREKLANILVKDTQFILDLPMSSKTLADFSGLKLDVDAHIQTPKETSFIPSPIAGVFPISREPANLSKYGPHTVKDVEKKSFTPVKSVMEDEIAFAGKVLEDYFADFGDLTNSEVIQGTKLLAPLNSTSSNGFGCLADKTDYINFTESCLTPLGKAEMDRIEASFESGDIDPKDIVWYSTLKDELRSKTKEGKPRSFRVSPLFIQLLTKKYFGHMVENIITHKHFSGVMVGLNPFSEWESIYANMRQCSGVWAGDIGNYDGNMLPQVQTLVSNIIMKNYVGKFPTAAEFLLQNLSTTVVAINDDAYLTTHSLPSGSFLTAIFNSLVNKAYTAMWFYRNVPEAHRKPSVFHTEVVDYVYGDDKLNGIRSNKFQDLNAVTMEKFFTSLGMTFTDASKKPITTPFQSLDEVSFLKRTFTLHPLLGKIVCPLDKETLYSGLSWLDSSKDGEVVMTDKINNFQREIFLHWETYVADVEHLQEYCAERKVFFQRLPLKYLMNLYLFDSDYVPTLSWGGATYR